MFRRPSPILPNLPILTLEWGFGEQFGGITNSAIQRTNAFAELGNRRMVFLTVDPNFDPNERTRQMRAEGRFSKLVSIRNVWHELRAMSDRKLRSYGRQIRSLQGDPSGPILEKPTGEYRAEQTSSKGNKIRTDYFREDGSVVVSDQHDLQIDGKRARRLTLFTSKGHPVGQWTNLSEFYFSWLDSVLGRDLCVLITDTGGIGGRMRGYDRDNVVKVQMLHNLHLKAGTIENDGPLDPIWKNVVINSDKYDVIGVLTEDQRRDLAETQLDPGNLKILSNMYSGSFLEEINPRPKTAGIQVSRLARQKRIDHTIRAIARSEVTTIDIYGFAYNDEFEQRLTDLIDELKVGDRVRLKGYDVQARERFRDRSFSLLPSLYEGQGLAIIESMAAGCIPIAYDVRYGPSSIITHGVDGFLVPSGDVEALATMIDHVATLDDETLARMRKSAVEKAKDYSPEQIVRDWGRVLREAIAFKPTMPVSRGTAVATSFSVDEEILAFGITVSGVASLDREAAIAWKSRSGDRYGRVPAKLVTEVGQQVVEGVVPATRLGSSDDEIVDFFIDVRSNGFPIRLRIKSNGLEIPAPAGKLQPYSTANVNLSVKVRTVGR